jgi:hypothetical protein
MKRATLKKSVKSGSMEITSDLRAPIRNNKLNADATKVGRWALPIVTSSLVLVVRCRGPSEKLSTENKS